MKVLWRVLVVVVSVSVAIPLIAAARHTAVRDPNDARGVLDIRRAEMVGSSRWKVTSRAGWSVKELWDRGFTLVYVDSFGSSRADYYVNVRSDGKKLRAALYRDPRGGKDRKLRSVRVRHPNKSAVDVSVPMNRLRRRDSRIFGWYVLTLFSGPSCRRVCLDRAPDRGNVTEPGPQPTPTLPTPTPTPSP